MAAPTSNHEAIRARAWDALWRRLLAEPTPETEDTEQAPDSPADREPPADGDQAA